MVRSLFLAGLISIAAFAADASAAADQPLPQSAAAPASPAYTTAATDIGTLLDDPAAKAVLDKHAPQFTANSQIQMARSMTLRQIQSYASDVLTDEVLTKIDADLAKLPAKK